MNNLTEYLNKFNDYFEFNDYFDKYVKLIESNSKTEYRKFYTQKHHIVPRHYYVQKQIQIDKYNARVQYVNGIIIKHSPKSYNLYSVISFCLLYDTNIYKKLFLQIYLYNFLFQFLVILSLCGL